MANNLDKEFDDLFSDGLLNSSQDDKPSNKEWANLNRRLKSNDKQVFAWWWLLIPLLLGFNGWLGFELFNLKIRENISIQNPLGTIGSNDITYQTHIIYDTIYRTVIVNKYIQLNQTQVQSDKIAPTQNITNRNNLFKTLENKKPDLPSVGQTEIAFNDISEESNNEKVDSPEVEKLVIKGKKLILIDKETEVSNEMTDKVMAVDTTAKSNVIEARSKDNNTLAKGATENKDLENKSVLSEISEYLNTKVLDNESVNYRMGVGIGSQFPLVKSSIEINSSYSVNLQGEILFGRKWAIVPEVFYGQNEFDIYSAKYLTALKLPQPILPGGEFQFDSAEGLHREIMPAISLRFRFASDQMWSWYVSSGWAVRYILPREVEYEFNKEKEDDVLYYMESVRTQVFSSYLKLNLGAQLNLNSRFSLYSEFNTFMDIGTNPRGMSNASGFFGIKYLIH